MRLADKGSFIAIITDGIRLLIRALNARLRRWPSLTQLLHPPFVFLAQGQLGLLRLIHVHRRRTAEFATFNRLAVPTRRFLWQVQNQPSAKATAKVSNLTLLPKTSGSGGWHTVLTQNIRTANNKDLFINASFEIGLFTQTKVSSKNMVDDVSVGQAEVDIRVLVDGREIEPGVVVFSRRTQTLSAQLEGAIGSCLVTTTNMDGSFSTTVDLECVQPETIELILDSLTASSFNFIAEDVNAGVHVVSIQARVDTIGSSMLGSYSALGLVGKGAAVIESTRMIKNEDVIDIP